MKEKLIEQIESKLETLENEAANKAVSNAAMKKNISEVKDFIYRSIKFANTINEPFTEEEQKVYLDRSDKLMRPYKISYLSTKKLVASVAIMAATGVGALAGVSSLCMRGCGKSNETEVINTQNVETENMESETEEKVEYTSMSDEMKAFADTTVEAVNDALEAGINLSVDGKQLLESDKQTYAKTLTQYRIVANLDSFTRLQYAELFGEMLDPTEDLMDGYNTYNEFTWKHLLTVTEDNDMLDYSNLYSNEKDAEVLNESYRLIVAINSSENKTDRLQAAKDWYSYVIGILTDNKGSNALSSAAMDTLIVHSEAYDELTRSYYPNIVGAHIDDELEHKFNVAKNVCLVNNSENNIDVKDIAINNLQSEFRISLKNELKSGYEIAITERDLQLALGKTLNEYNSFNENVSYVEEKIDLSLYKEVEITHIEKQYEEKGINAPAQKAKDDSGVSNGNGGNISNTQFNKYGIDPSSPTAREELEQAVQEETKKQEEESIRVEDGNGNVIQTSDYIDGFNAGYSAAMNGQSKPAYTGNQSYNAGLDSGWSKGLADKQAFENNFKDDTETEYVPVENGETTIIESEPITEDYTDSEDNNYMDEETTFVPIDEVDAGYTRAIKETDEKINELLAYRDFLAQYASVEEINQENQIRL